MSQSEVFAGKPGSDISGAGSKIFNQLPVATCNPFQRNFLTRIVANRQGDAFGSFEQSVEESHPFRMLHVFELQSKHCLVRQRVVGDGVSSGERSVLGVEPRRLADPFCRRGAGCNRGIAALIH
jgi:hypothetical protein